MITYLRLWSKQRLLKRDTQKSTSHKEKKSINWKTKLKSRISINQRHY